METAEVTNLFTSVIEWVKEFWEGLDIKGWAQSIGGSSSEAVEAAVYFGSGFAVGFLFKKYFKFVFLSLLFAAVFIKVLEYNQVLTIDWEAFNSMLGFESTADVSTFINSIFDWIKMNWIVFASSFVGFLIGYKLG